MSPAPRLRRPSANRRRLAALAVLAAATAAAAGCASADDGQEGSETRPAPPTAVTSDMTPAPASTAGAPAPEVTEEEMEVVTVFLSDDQGSLVAVEVSTAGRPPLQAGVEALADPPEGSPAPAALPPGTVVRSVRAEAGVATVDLSSEFVDGYPAGGSAAEAAVLGPLVYTVTEVEGIDGAFILVEGAAPELLGSAYDFSAPLTRDDVPVAVGEAP